MKIHNVEQGSDEWLKVRRFKLTASHGTEIGNSGAGLKTYIKKLVVDGLFPDSDRYVSADMERGNLLEPIARAKYEFENNVEVVEVGFVEHCPHSGCSPDGMVNDDGLIEIKARNDVKHYEHILGAPVDSGTNWQIQMQLLVTNRQWCDFITYNPNFKQSMIVIRVERDEDKIEKLKKGLIDGIKQLTEQLKHPNVIKEIKHESIESHVV